LVAGANVAATGTTGLFGNTGNGSVANTGAIGAVAVGNATTLATDAPTLLVNGGFTMARNIQVGALTNTRAYNATLGGNNTSGTSTFSGDITLRTVATNSTVTLRAATGGTVDFTGAWTTNNKAINIGSTGQAGTVKLSSSLATTGGVNVQAGTLLANSTLDSAVTVASGATLGGTGTVGGATTIQSGGTLAVGNSPGVQNFGSGLTFDSGSIFAWDIAANSTTGRGTNYDGVNVTGNLTVTAGATFRVIQNAGADFADSFWDTNKSFGDIFSVSGSTSSAWSNTAVAVYNTSNVLQDVTTRGSFSVTGSTLNWTAVPEASNLLIGGLLGLGLMSRRRKQA
jgi:hypothetical protein